MKYDLLIKNGQIFNSKKKDFTPADIAIKGDKIKKIGKIEEKDAEKTINADGKYVCPGFIDLTSHSDTYWTLFSNPYQQSFISQGITTILGGNCGASLAPLITSRDIEAIQKWTDISKININWQSVKEFLNELEKSEGGLGINFGTLVGHGNLRRAIVGDETRKATKSEIDKMKLVLDMALKEGAFGMSFNLASAHEKESDEKEVEGLSEVVAKNNGLIKHHLRDEGKNILPSVAHILNYLRISKARTQISHFKVIGKTAWEKFDEVYALIENAVLEKLPISIDFSPYERTGSSLYMLLPEWVVRNGKRDILHVIKDIHEKRNIIDYFKSLTLHYDKITVASALHDKNSIGKTISEISLKTELSPEEVMLNLIDLNELNVSVFSEAINKVHVEELLKKPHAYLSTDGAGYDLNNPSDNSYDMLNSKLTNEENYTHPRSFGTFPKVFKEFVRERNIITLGEAVHKSSFMPAKIMGLEDRGDLKEGYFADIAVLDLQKTEDLADYKNPFQFSKGIDYVLINGELAIENGGFTFKKGGRVLRKN